MSDEKPETGATGRDHLPGELITGYENFLAGRFTGEQARFRQLAERGQKPKIMLIGCSDSRVSPEVIFDAAPGEIFVVRNVANLIPPYTPNQDLHGTSAALEFGIIALAVEHIVVMGHALCGGVKAYAQSVADPDQTPLSPGDFIGNWITLIEPAAARIEPGHDPFDTYVERLAQTSVIQGLANLRTFPFIKAREDEGKLKLHGAYFGIAEGRLLALDEATGEFLPVAGGTFAEKES
jgi:carbonic anhydrase